jgi:Leucine-rich repeat (LRR) protein
MKSLNILGIIISLMVLVIPITGCTSSGEFFADKNLETAIRDSLDLLLGERITTDNLANLVRLSGADSNISDLSGIGYCFNLVEVDLPNNKISDISPLFSLDNLVTLNLQNNQISQIPAACTFFSLVTFNLAGNQISDISPFNSISNLTNLSIAGNKLTDISPLKSLVNLMRLNLSGNQISDISPLLENTGLVEGDDVNLTGNSLDLSEGSEDIVNIQALENRGVRVIY